MDKHATITICVRDDENFTLHKIVRIIYENDGSIQNINTNLYQTGMVYSHITFNATTNGIIKILQNKNIVNLLYR